MNVMLPKTSQIPERISKRMMAAINFRFFWHPLASEFDENEHQIFEDALSFHRKRLAQAYVSLQLFLR